MSQYLLVESRDPFESTDVATYLSLASDLAAQGHAVTLFLVQNAVLAARGTAPKSAMFTSLAKAGVTVLADDFSLAERGIAAARLAEGIQSSPIDVVVDRLEAGAKTLWH